MARFTGSATPAVNVGLILQVQSTSSGAGSYLTVFAVKVDSQTTVGTVTRPVLYRPSVLGVGSGVTPEIRGQIPNAVPAASFISSFSSTPSYPTSISSGAFPLPIRISWMVPPAEGVIAANGGALCVVAGAGGDGSGWAGSISWEEA